jgi:hypothetical protein
LRHPFGERRPILLKTLQQCGDLLPGVERELREAVKTFPQAYVIVTKTPQNQRFNAAGYAGAAGAPP